MPINTHEVYFKCPVCGEVSTYYDYHENTSSDNAEYFCVLNIGKPSNHLWVGNPAKEHGFICPHCKSETSYDLMFTPGNCWVEDLERYKVTLRRFIRLADRNGNVRFSDWDPNWGEEPALTRLISMYPADDELKKIRNAYRRLHVSGKRAFTKLETNNEVVSRDVVLIPESLERVYMGNNVRKIDAHAFENCIALGDVFIPDSVTSVGDYAFAESGLHKVHVSDSINSIGKRAFSQTWIARFFFPASIREIGEECFAQCKYLNNLWIPAEAHVGRDAFAGCTGLKHIQISAKVPDEIVATWGLSDKCIIERYE